MMGHGYQGHARLEHNISTRRCYWWMKVDSGRLLWPGMKYVRIEKYYDTELSNPIRSNTWVFYYTPNEYLIKVLKGA